MSSLPDLPAVVGDPAGMRQLAGTLRGLAQQVGGHASSVAGAIGAASWTGPAAAQFRSAATGWDRDVAAAAGELLEAAGALETSATQVEQEQAARARLEHQLLEERLRDR